MVTSGNESFVKLLRAMGDEARFQIIKLLLGNDLCVGALARILNISKPAVSQHLKVLRGVGLVKGEKRGYWTHYQVQKEVLQITSCGLQDLVNSTGKEAYFCLRNSEDKISLEREGRVPEVCENCCEKPDKLKIKPEKCTPEQINECHGDAKDHSCECSNEE